MARAFRIAIGGMLAAAACADLGGLQSGQPDAAADAAVPPTPVPPPAADAADAGGYGATVLADSPIAYWPFDEAVGSSVASDVVGKREASVVGVVTFGAPGVSGTAIVRDPGGGQLDVGDAFDFVGASAFSVELWATPALTSSFQNVAEKRAFDGGVADGWVLYFNSVDGGMAEVQFEQPAWGAADQRVAWSEIDGAARPLHVVVTYDSSQGIRLYVNDVRTANAFDADGGPIANGIALTLLGGYTGMLDELAIYDHALSQDRVAAHFHAAGR